MVAPLPVAPPGGSHDFAHLVRNVPGMSSRDLTAPAADTIDLTGDMPDLAPMIHRQRLVIEGTCPKPITAEEITSYLRELSVVTDMVTLIEPVTHRSDQFGWAGWIHWETSGAHFYAWERPVLFFSVDIYTCKPFDPMKAVQFTRRFFDADTIVSKPF